MVDPQGQAIKWIKNMEMKRVRVDSDDLITIPCHLLSLVVAVGELLFWSNYVHLSVSIGNAHCFNDNKNADKF